MLSPRQTAPSQPVSFRRILLALFACTIIAMILLAQKNYLNEYWLYFTEQRKPASFNFLELSESWTERSLRERFSGYPIGCYQYQGDLPVDRACGVDVSSHNGVPALYISFFFADGHLDQVSVNIPWWSHGTALKSMVAAFGQPTASQSRFRAGVRLHGWPLRNGAALFFNRDRPVNPLTWNAIYWRSASTCQKGGCFARN